MWLIASQTTLASVGLGSQSSRWGYVEVESYQLDLGRNVSLLIRVASTSLMSLTNFPQMEEAT